MYSERIPHTVTFSTLSADTIYATTFNVTQSTQQFVATSALSVGNFNSTNITVENATITNLNNPSVNGLLTTVNTNSANWTSTYTTVQANSSNWQSTYTNFTNNSANYILVGGNTKSQNITIGTEDQFHLNFETYGQTRATILSTGEVGIGGSNPNEKLTVFGNISATDTLISSNLKVNQNNEDKDLQIGSQTVDFLIGTDASTSRVCINHSTNAPAGTLDIRSTNNVPCLVVNANTLISDFKIGSSTVDHMLYGAANNSRIGINTSTPTGSLDIVRYGASSANGPILVVNADNKDADFQFGSQTTDFLLFGDASTNTLGVNLSTPNERLTVAGNISATGIVYGSNSNSANWTNAFTNVQSNSGNWTNVFTNVQSNSGNWTNVFTNVQSNSGNWTNVFTNVQSNSAQWASNIDTGVRGLTGNWQSTYTTFTNNSTNYILQGGNSLSQLLLIGTNDSNHLEFETANTTRVTILSTGLITFVGSISSNNTTTSFNQGSATGSRSFAVNSGRAYGIESHAEGLNTTASGNYSHAEGATTRATADGAHAEGINTVASGSYSHAEGGSTTASGDQSHAEGSGTTASAFYSHAENYNTTASGNYSHAEGSGTTASNTASHAEGVNTRASGINSHAEGSNTEAKGLNSHAAGTRATAAQNYTYAWSDGNLGTASTNISTTKTGQYMVSASGGVFIPGEIQAGRYTNSQRNILISTSFGASADSFYLVNTISSVVSATLPSTPLTGDSIKFSDPFSTWNTNLFVVNRNGNNIERLAENLFCDVAGSQFTLTFVGSSVGWKVY